MGTKAATATPAIRGGVFEGPTRSGVSVSSIRGMLSSTSRAWALLDARGRGFVFQEGRANQIEVLTQKSKKKEPKKKKKKKKGVGGGGGGAAGEWRVVTKSDAYRFRTGAAFEGEWRQVA